MLSWLRSHTCRGARIWASSFDFKDWALNPSIRGQGYSKTMTTAGDHNANNNRGQLQRRLSQSPWLLFFKSHSETSCFFIPLSHTHTHTHTNRIKSPDAQCPHSWQVRNNQSKGSQRQSVTISVTAGEVTNDTERGRKGKTENTDAKLYGTWIKHIMTGLSHREKKKLASA